MGSLSNVKSFFYSKKESAYSSISSASSISDAESQKPFLPGSDELIDPPQEPALCQFRIHLAFTILHALIATLWISTFITFRNLNHCPETALEIGGGNGLLRPFEFEPVAEAISYEEVTFKISGGGTRQDPVTPYEGPPNEERDRKWYELMDVGMLALTPEMNATLRTPTQPASADDDTPLIQLDVFHQLHCLNAIRNIVYGTNKFYNPDDRQDQIHIDHCLDYLRQTLMCHSDVTPITHAKRPKPYNPALTDWRPNFAVKHTCRNFWKIHDWARQFNTSGYVIEAWPGTDPVAELRGN